MKIAKASLCRPLISKPLTMQFVEGILEIENLDDVSEATNKITRAEMLLAQYNNEDTISSTEFRDIKYQSELVRKKLRLQIFEELINNKRIENDDEIKMGIGGAMPITDIQFNKQAIIVTGLPASGKSTISSKFSDEYGAIILDSDYAKRKFPEFSEEFGATLVHEESSEIIFGSKTNPALLNLKSYSISRSTNVIIPKIGNTKDSVLDLANYFKGYGYDVHLVLISLDRKDATKRAYKRFNDTNRYVPLSLIFDSFSNDPILTYYRIKNHEVFKSYGKISTLQRPPMFVEGSPESPVFIFKI